ncbi:chorismate mutase [Segniliparus rugosus]|uniref:Chorismate mutase n=1 Tax=Segniliparus rugosus (strain ATCC BAA-974 / DSM 45345 / CCUG 50838 / CIP 108380 / JCM 13579 / CDC 945) TaxID=679197 RepID=E5XTW3_SEGRC|nr:chorismate mutase [Segniliparus rugosus]EFV12243.1 chorismate mutase [Segniliparus rugosus ATCC BAA-974]
MTTPPESSPAEEIAALRVEIDQLDNQILEAVKRRTALSRRIGQLRMSQGQPRTVHSREIAVLSRFNELGHEEGQQLGMLLLQLGRGKPGIPVQ